MTNINRYPMTDIKLEKTQAAAKRLIRAIKAMDVDKDRRIDGGELATAKANGKASEVAAVYAMRLSANKLWFSGRAPAGTKVSDDVARVTSAQQKLRNIDEFAGDPVVRAADPTRRRPANTEDGLVNEAEIRNYGGLSWLSEDLIKYANR